MSDYMDATKFQFHKVQLKESAKKMGWKDFAMFQFHKVQLKVFFGRDPKGSGFRFNSIRYN